MLRSLLTYAQHDDSVAKLSAASRREPQRAFVSSSLRPYLLASLIDAEPDRPALIVAGDDRAARDLAADLRQFLAPRQVRFYPARGMRYESHSRRRLTKHFLVGMDEILENEHRAR